MCCDTWSDIWQAPRCYNICNSCLILPGRFQSRARCKLLLSALAICKMPPITRSITTHVLISEPRVIRNCGEISKPFDRGEDIRRPIEFLLAIKALTGGSWSDITCRGYCHQEDNMAWSQQPTSELNNNTWAPPVIEMMINLHMFCIFQITPHSHNDVTHTPRRTMDSSWAGDGPFQRRSEPRAWQMSSFMDFLCKSSLFEMRIWRKHLVVCYLEG